MNNKQEILDQIRTQGRAAKGKPLVLLSLPDKALYEVFLQMKTGVGNRPIARLLQRKYGLSGSENSIQQAVGKLKERISSLLVSEDPVMRVPRVAKSLFPDLPPDEEMSRLREIERRYGALIEHELEMWEDRDTIPLEIHKHVTALGNLSKSRARLEQKTTAPQPPAAADQEFKRRADRVLKDFIGNDGQAMAEAANKFLQECEKLLIDFDQDPNTGEWYPRESRHTRRASSAPARLEK